MKWSRLLVTLYLSLDSLLAEGGDLLQGLRDTVPGEPGLDYPILSSPQSSSFSCRSRVEGGYYADVDQRCQVYHVCLHQTEVSFLCPNGTLFNQNSFVCDWWFNVDCEASAQHFDDVQGAFGGEDYPGVGAGVCPAVTGGECVGSVSTCWSPGQRDTDCPLSGLCCFDGCANTCLDSPPSKPTPTAASTTPSPRPGTAPAVTTWRPAYSTEDGGYLYHAPPPQVPSLYGPPRQG